MKMYKTNTPVECVVTIGNYDSNKKTIAFVGYPIAPRQRCNVKGCETLTLKCLNCRYNRVNTNAFNSPCNLDNPLEWLQRHTLCCYEWQREQDKAEVKRQLAEERKLRRK